MARTNTTDKATVKNGRASRATGEAYNANHNTLEATRLNQAHIDSTRTRLNMYIMFDADRHIKVVHGGKGGFDARAHEMKMYEHFYAEGLEAKNARYIADRHPEDCKTMKDLYTSPKTAPLETIFQVGSTKSVIDKETRHTALKRAWQATMKEFMRLYGENFVPLDMALHRDEAEDHMHNRVMLMARDKFGHLVPNQTAALEAMGFERPDPDKPRSRRNNALITFTDALRETFYRCCEKEGIQIDREVTSHSKRQVELLEYKCEQFRKEMEVARVQAAQAQQEVQTAQKVLEKSIGDIKTLKTKIEGLERSQTTLEDRNRRISAENQTLKQENQNLRSENTRLETQKGTLEDQLTNLQQQMEKAQKEKAEAEQAKAIALEKLKQYEAHEAELFKQYQSRKVKNYGTLPAQKEKRSFSGKVTQEALPERVIVDKADFERQTKQAEYHVMVDFNQATMEALDKRLSEKEVVQHLIAQLNDQKMQINRLKLTADKMEITIMQQRDVLQRYGLEHEVGRPIQSQEYSHDRHR